MRERDPLRWGTRFGSWVQDYSVERLRADLAADMGYSLTRGAIYSWMRGESAPRVEHTQAVVRLSGGALGAQDVHEHVLTVRGSFPPGTMRVTAMSRAF